MSIIAILFLHWVGDFVLQSDWMAQNKSKNAFALLAHCIVYTVPFLVFLTPFTGARGFIYLFINFCLHFTTDYFTSKCTAKLWEKGDRHNFFVVIGADQLIHSACLIGTMFILY